MGDGRLRAALRSTPGLSSGCRRQRIGWAGRITVPVSLNYTFWSQDWQNNLDLEFGLVYQNGIGHRGLMSSGYQDVEPILTLGYRHLPAGSGFVFRAGFNVLLKFGTLVGVYQTNASFRSDVGLSFGYPF